MRKQVLVNSLMFFAFAAPALAKDIKTTVGSWQICYSTTTHTFSYMHDGRTIVGASAPEARYVAGGVEYNVTAADYGKAELQKTDDGQTFYLTDKKAHEALHVEFTPCGDALLTRLVITSDREVASNYLAPVCLTSAQTMEGSECRMLKVPYDNDDFVRYHYNRLDGSPSSEGPGDGGQFSPSSEGPGEVMLSYEVTALFDGVSRRGTIIGSVDHDHWKSGVEVRGTEGNTITALKAYSGVSTRETRDLLPHGSLVGREVQSARFFIADESDWRDGLEHYAAACAAIQPGRQTWTGGTPFGWQSWGVMSSHNSFEVDVAVADYYATQLRDWGFSAPDGLQIMSIDAWDNLKRDQKPLLTAHCEEMGQITGLYRSPFALWWGNESDLERPLFRGAPHKAKECVLYANGKPIKYDGAFCLDPTHPTVKQMITRDMEEARRQGFRYVKVDFTCNGMIQADSYYNKDVHTAVEAYNEGMQHFTSQCVDKDGKPMFIALSIAPIFPYQYGNSRRIACDTWGKINQSEYAMNAIGGGWWTNGFYQRNDPDHIVLVGNDEVKETEGENRARLTTGITSGMILLADNYDIADTISHCGNAQLSRERAALLLSNRATNALAQRVTRSFRPVYGYKSHNGQPAGAENMVMQVIDGTTYVAIINYGDAPMSGSLPLADLGLPAGTYNVSELWTSVSSIAASLLTYDIPAKDARIYSISK